MTTTKIHIPGPIVKTEQNGIHGAILEVDTGGGWGQLCESLLRQACEVAGQPDMLSQFRDLLMAAEPSCKVTTKLADELRKLNDDDIAKRGAGR